MNLRKGLKVRVLIDGDNLLMEVKRVSKNKVQLTNGKLFKMIDREDVSTLCSPVG